jgi:hypothetical protein
MRIEWVPGVQGNRLLNVTRIEYTVVRVSIAALVDLCESNPELFAGHDRILALVGVAKDMCDEMRGTGGDLVPVQDQAVRTPSKGYQTYLPAMEPRFGVGSVVRSENRENEDHD